MTVSGAGGRRIALAAFLLFLCLTLLVPISEVIRVSLVGDDGAFTIDNYVEILGSSYFGFALLETLAFCVATSVLSVLLALPAAWRIGRGGRGAAWLRAFCQANYAFGGIVYGMLMVALIGNVGLVPLAEQALFGTEVSRGFVYTLPGLVIAYFGFQIPRAALLLAQPIEKIAPTLLNASRSMGARAAQTACLVVLPLLRAPMINAALSNFLISLGSFGVALLVARKVPIFAVLIYKEFVAFDDFGTACAMAVILTLSAVASVVLLRRFTEQTDLRGL